MATPSTPSTRVWTPIDYVIVPYRDQGLTAFYLWHAGDPRGSDIFVVTNESASGSNPPADRSGYFTCFEAVAARLGLFFEDAAASFTDAQ